MTIRFLRQWNGYDDQDVASLSGSEETRLVGLGLATFTTHAEKSASGSVTNFPAKSAVPAGFEGPAWFENTGQMAGYKKGVAVGEENTYPITLPNVYVRGITQTLSPPTPYLGISDGAITHPMLVQSRTRFGGYSYWLAYTPYPGNNSVYENPCVVASNDLTNWVNPTQNPLVLKPSGGYNADTHIAFNTDESVLYMVYRERIDAANNTLKLMHTTDGVTWSSPVSLKSGVAGTEDYGCPSLFYNPRIDKWQIISHNLDNASRPTRIITSATNDPYSAWGAPVTLSIPTTALSAIWHSGWIMTKSGQLVGVGSENTLAGGGSEGKCYLWYSINDTEFKKSALDIPVQAYRPALIIINDKPFMLISHLSKSYFELFSLESSEERTAKEENYTAFKSMAKIPISYDSFTRADGVVSVADTGQAWIGTPTLSIVSNRAVATNGTGCKTYVLTGCYNVEAILDVEVMATGETWLMLRVVDASNFIRVGYGNSNELKIQEVKAGAVNQSIAVMAPGRPAKMSVTLIDQHYRVEINGCAVLDGEFPLVSTIMGTGYGVQITDTGATFKARSLLVIEPIINI